MSGPEIRACLTCGHPQQIGQHGEHDCLGRVKAQRDELLDALRDALPAVVNCERAYRRIGEGGVGHVDFAQKLARIKSVIANTPGGEGFKRILRAECAAIGCQMERAANARRLAACWNACEGLDTELLENILTLGDTLKTRFDALTSRLAELEGAA